LVLVGRDLYLGIGRRSRRSRGRTKWRV